MSDERKPGRPRSIEGPGSSVMAWVPKDVHDRLIERATVKSVSVSALIRQELIRQFPTKK